MESVPLFESMFEGLSPDWLMVAGVIFVLPKVVVGTLVVLLANAEKVPFLDRLLGDRIRSVKVNLNRLLPSFGRGKPPQSLKAASTPTRLQEEPEEPVLPKR